MGARAETSSTLGYLLIHADGAHYWDGNTWRRISGRINGAEFLVRTPIDPLTRLYPDLKTATAAAQLLARQRGEHARPCRLRFVCQ